MRGEVCTHLYVCMLVYKRRNKLVLHESYVQDVTEQLADKSAQLQQACQNPLFSPEKPQPGSPSTPRGPALTAESSSLTLQVAHLSCIRQNSCFSFEN